LLRAFGLGAILFGFWLLLSGYWYDPLLVGLGVGSCALVVYLCRRMDAVDREGIPLHVGGRFWLYVPWLMKEIFMANVAVAKIIIDRELPISPRMVVFHGSQQTDLGKALYASSITLTPGTITTGVAGHDFEIHALTEADLETDEQEQMDRRCTRVEQGG
jgi:multicomponent Na+:H+ antiporter subunit E